MDNCFDDIFGCEEFEVNEDNISEEDCFADIFGEESLGDDIFGEEVFGEDIFGEDIFGEEVFEEEVLVSNMHDWLNTDDNPELINLNCKNPNTQIYFKDPNFNYSADYSNLRFIFEKFRSDLVEGEF